MLIWLKFLENRNCLKHVGFSDILSSELENDQHAKHIKSKGTGTHCESSLLVGLLPFLCSSVR